MPLRKGNPFCKTSVGDVVVVSVERFINDNSSPDSSVLHSLGNVKEILGNRCHEEQGGVPNTG